jgi:3-hydroxybutyryl-CoA dehydratase
MKVGEKFSHQFVVTEDIYKGFIQMFRDKNPLHIDVSFARQHGFSSCVMHGNILGGFISYFIGECLPFKNVIIHSQELKFIKPIYLNDGLSLSAEVQEFYASVNVYKFSFVFRKHSSDEIVARGKIQIGII